MEDIPILLALLSWRPDPSSRWHPANYQLRHNQRRRRRGRQWCPPFCTFFMASITIFRMTHTDTLWRFSLRYCKLERESGQWWSCLLLQSLSINNRQMYLFLTPGLSSAFNTRPKRKHWTCGELKSILGLTSHGWSLSDHPSQDFHKFLCFSQIKKPSLCHGMNYTRKDFCTSCRHNFHF